jgi:D-alanyl-D-alanine carboxypeptidase
MSSLWYRPLPAAVAALLLGAAPLPAQNPPAATMRPDTTTRAALVAVARAAATLPPTAAAVPPRNAAAIIVEPVLQKVDSLLTTLYPDGGPGAAVIVAQEGRVLLRKAYGLANVELGVAATPEHAFRIGSMTNQATAVAILLLAEQGALNLDDDITKHLPEWPAHGERITIEHLLTHTSGIPNHTNLPESSTLLRRDTSLPDLLAMFRDAQLEFAPGTDWRYNDAGYLLLGAIIERVSGMGYAEFLRSRLFEPLGMRDTYYDGAEVILPRRVSGHAPSAAGVLHNAAYSSMTLPYAAGALVSTVDDQLRWQRAIAAGELLRPATWSRALTSYRLADGRPTGYGHGWFIGSLMGGTTVEHGGDVTGFASEGFWLPSVGVHVIVLSNAARSYANPAAVPVAVADVLLADCRLKPPDITPEQLDEYVGVYAVSELERRVVVRNGATLYTVLGSGTPQALRPAARDAFVNPSTGARVVFHRDTAGDVVDMQLMPRVGMAQAPSARTTESPDSVLTRYRAEVELSRP